jgi:hypothetical protein
MTRLRVVEELMPLVDRETFAEAACARIYVARTLAEARQVESVLSTGGFDYVVEVEPFRTLLLGVLPRQYDGAVFYVLSADADACRTLLFEANVRAGLVNDDDSEDPPDAVP